MTAFDWELFLCNILLRVGYSLPEGMRPRIAGGAGGGEEGRPLGLSLGYFERGNAIPWLAGYSLPEGMRPQARWDMTVVLEMGGGRTTGTVPGLI